MGRASALLTFIPGGGIAKKAAEGWGRAFRFAADLGGSFGSSARKLDDAVESTAKKVDDAGFSKQGNPAEVPSAKGGTYALRSPETGQVVRTGQTNDLARRRNEHARNSATRDLDFEIDRYSDDLKARRGREQILYDNNTQAQGGNGGLNKRRPISPTNPRLNEYLEAGRKL